MLPAKRKLLVAQASILATLVAPGAAQARDVVVSSFDGTPIVAHFYPAATTRPGERVPTVLFGAGFATRGPTAPDPVDGVWPDLDDLQDAGFNVLTWDARGFGGSGGTSMFDSPAFEARDVQALIGYVAQQPEALLDGPGDPRVGMSGPSYGGAIQLIVATIDPRVDAIVPELTWSSLVTSFAKDGAFKAAWLVQLCANGETFGLLDGVTDGLTGLAGVQLGSVDPRFRAMCLEGTVLGRLSPATTQWLSDIGPGPLVARIRAPTLLIQGVADTLVPASEAIASYAGLRAAGVPLKMLWVCGGHSTCTSPAGDPAVARGAALTWFRRWLKRDATVDTGPAFEWIDDGGTWRSGPDYPLAAAGAVQASGAGSMIVLPSVTATQATTVVSSPPSGTLEIRYAPPPAASDIVGEPALSMTYHGFALPSSTFVYAQVVDAAAGRVADNQITPIPVVLDGLAHTVTRKLEALALRGGPGSDLRLQITTSTSLYGPQRSAGTIAVSSMTSTLPLVDAARAAAPRAAAPVAATSGADADLRLPRALVRGLGLPASRPR